MLFDASEPSLQIQPRIFSSTRKRFPSPAEAGEGGEAIAEPDEGRGKNISIETEIKASILTGHRKNHSFLIVVSFP